MSSIFHVALCKEAVVDIMISSHCRKKFLGAFPSPTPLGQSTAESKSQIAAYMLQRIVGTSACVNSPAEVLQVWLNPSSTH